jgi:hypothetical protein
MDPERGPETGAESIAEELASSYQAAQTDGQFTTEAEVVSDLSGRIDRGDVTIEDAQSVLERLFPDPNN